MGECEGVPANTQNYLMGCYRVCYGNKSKPLDEEMGSLAQSAKTGVGKNFCCECTSDLFDGNEHHGRVPVRICAWESGVCPPHRAAGQLPATPTAGPQ